MIVYYWLNETPRYVIDSSPLHLLYIVSMAYNVEWCIDQV